MHMRTVGSIAAVILLMLVASPAARAQYFSLGKGTFPLEPYDVDSSGRFLVLGGELREQYWNQVSEADALRAPINDTYDLQRVALNALLHFNSHVSAFGELVRADSFDKVSPSTTDRTRGRLQQGFVQGEDVIGDLSLYARVGRQEITLGSGRFVWINDSSNVRTTHDGARLHVGFNDGVSVDLIVSRPVTPTYRAFDDWNSHAGSLGAVYASEPFLANQLHVDEYFYYRRVSAIQFGSLTGTDERDTVGGRIWGAVGSLNIDG